MSVFKSDWANWHPQKQNVCPQSSEFGSHACELLLESRKAHVNYTNYRFDIQPSSYVLQASEFRIHNQSRLKKRTKGPESHPFLILQYENQSSFTMQSSLIARNLTQTNFSSFITIVLEVIQPIEALLQSLDYLRSTLSGCHFSNTRH